MSTTNMFKYVHGEVFEATKIAQPIPGTGIVNIVGSDGVTPIGFTSISLFADSSGTTELVLGTDFTIQEKDIEYSAREGVDVYRSVQIINPAYQSAVFYADFDAVGGYAEYNPYPVGSFYTQYPDADSNDLAVAFPDAYRPADLFGGTWVAQWDDEGIDFHTERTSDVGLQTRTDGKQADQMQQITGKIEFRRTGSTAQLATPLEPEGALQGSAGTGASLGTCYPTNAVTHNMDRLFFNSAKSPGARTGTVTCDANRLVRIWKRTA